MLYCTYYINMTKIYLTTYVIGRLKKCERHKEIVPLNYCSCRCDEENYVTDFYNIITFEILFECLHLRSNSIYSCINVYYIIQ